MSHMISTTVYQLDELSAPAREKARVWYSKSGLEYDWYSDIYEDFTQVCNILGVRLNARIVTTVDGSHRKKTCVWFSGFCSQGDGACFEGHYRYQPQAARNIRDHAPQDEELHRIADELQAIQQRHFWQIQADIQHRGRYYHAYTMDITVTRHNVAARDVTEDAEHALSEVLYDLAHWLYCQLQNEYAWLTSPTAVDEAILANDYTFTESGQRFG
ncbi:antitoxin of toxin-antitoxin stability system [Klebsiella michiganensis]|uniref:antitoxin of toxin-antitoxin stability system n=1 Tax=Klebsiella/Raoultella group TaxID=2890311 RepID=UPI00164A7B98|nr:MULTISPECIES: antitoxin of toxin-antitoxin stability system [Klebsiella]MDZ0109089.1 antitoxin of toxin-antitoxin stability system [Klebsiella pneumoniae]MBC4644035.1 antitoxin of toxin-antitoxin stability system [Klebsiella quasipneumoniae]MBZ7210619.1 antitoxin of toxin-antitoxin stability system [Klebsiella michiganensis]MDS7843888.1 antitoxin of toxin-antitoxin stability system [Klebsiella michiganensis]HDX9076776.1 antitoxin of toxin-antitoxin stability system [Klebsiella michiganensis